MNSSGKERAAKTIGQTITSLSTCENPPISLKLEEVPLAAPSVETKIGLEARMMMVYTKMQLGHHADRRDLRYLEMKIFLWVT
jgi:hypothetical protein